jgi:hypothetical protein|nr:MAG TPA: hypothetical protein [Caudoviricetes sp.]
MTAIKTKPAAAETQAPIKFEDIPGAELMRPIKTFTAAEQARFTGRMTAILGADFDVKNATEQEIDLSKLDFDKLADLIEWATENLAIDKEEFEEFTSGKGGMGRAFDLILGMQQLLGE